MVVDLPHRHHEKGNPFGLRIAVTALGEEIAVIRDAFDVVRRRLQDDGEKRRPAAGSSSCASGIVQRPDVYSRRI